METIALLQLDRLAAFIVGSELADALEVGTTSFEAIYEAHYRDVSRHVILTTGGRDDVEEIVAETFARAFTAWRSGRGPAGRPLPWLLVIARRIATDRWRRRRLIAWLPFPGGRPNGTTNVGIMLTSNPEVSTGMPGTAQFWLWMDALSRALPARQRDVIFLRYQHELTDEDIGEVLGLSASGVRTLVSRALSGLRKHPELWSRPGRTRADPRRRRAASRVGRVADPVAACVAGRAITTSDLLTFESWPDRRCGGDLTAIDAWACWSRSERPSARSSPMGCSVEALDRASFRSSSTPSPARPPRRPRLSWSATFARRSSHD